MNTELDQKFLENWQYYLKDQIKDVRLVDLIIPGTHNSNTYTFDQIGCAFGKNQVLDIDTQLKSGIRFLDLRYGLNKEQDQIVDKHGPLRGSNYFEKFSAIKNFLDNHKNEFLVIKIQAEDEFNEKQKNDFKLNLQDQVGQYLINSNDEWFDLSKVTMKQIQKYKKRIFLVYKKHLTEFPNCENIGLYPDEGHLDCFWPNKDNVKDLMKENYDVLQERQQNKDKQNILQLNSFILTGQEDISQLIKQIVLQGIPTIEHMVKQLDNNREIMQFILDNIQMPYNIILMDRMDKFPELILFIVILNIKSKIQNKFCYYNNQDITKEINSCIFNQQLICIQNFKQLIKENNDQQQNPFILYNYNKENIIYEIKDLDNTILIYDNPLIEQQRHQINFDNLYLTKDLQKQFLQNFIEIEEDKNNDQQNNTSNLEQEIIIQYLKKKIHKENPNNQF